MKIEVGNFEFMPEWRVCGKWGCCHKKKHDEKGEYNAALHDACGVKHDSNTGNGTAP
ncbi:MAG TPA: hypothetical protein HPP94_01295 [Desulfuromonadales bacterium]|nr:hypothetical protein [Desulfuromonadales bacterium]